LGVRNLCTEFLPDSVAHLSQHFTKKAMNRLFPFSVVFGTIAAAILLRAAFDPASSLDHAAGSMLVATLVALGVIEHWLLVTPLSALDLFSTSSRNKRVTLARPVGALRPMI